MEKKYEINHDLHNAFCFKVNLGNISRMWNCSDDQRAACRNVPVKLSKLQVNDPSDNINFMKLTRHEMFAPTLSLIEYNGPSRERITTELIKAKYTYSIILVIMNYVRVQIENDKVYISENRDYVRNESMFCEIMERGTVSPDVPDPRRVI